MHAFMIQSLFAPKGCIPMRARLGEKNSRNVRQATGRVFLKFAELKKFELKAQLTWPGEQCSWLLVAFSPGQWRL